MIGSVTTASAVVGQVYYSRKTLKQERALRNEEKFELHSKRIARAIYDGCERGSNIFYTCKREHGSLKIVEPPGPETQAWPNAVKHFKSYPELWKLREEAIKQSEENCKQAKSIYEEYKKLVFDTIKAKLPTVKQVSNQFNASKELPPDTSVFIEGHLVDGVYREAYQGLGIPEITIFKNVNNAQSPEDVPPGAESRTWKTLLFYQEPIFHGTEDDRKFFGKVVCEIIGDPKIQSLAKQCEGLLNARGRKEMELLIERAKFWNNMNDGVPLLGKCPNCEGLF